MFNYDAKLLFVKTKNQLLFFLTCCVEFFWMFGPSKHYLFVARESCDVKHKRGLFDATKSPEIPLKVK